VPEAPSFSAQYDAIIEQQLLRNFYGDSGYFNTGYWVPGTASAVEACDHLMQRVAEGLPPGRRSVLDVGCGLGGSTRWLLSHFPGSRITAINFSPRQTWRTQRRLPAVRCAVVDAAHLAFADESFDTVIAVESAFHFRTRRKFLEEAWRVLVPGRGALALTDILFTDPSAIGPGMVPAENQVAGLEGYTTLLQETGFSEVRLVDATDECWGGFCTQLGNFIQRFDAGARLAYEPLLARLRTSCVGHYLLGWAVKR
jgi:cyclopropane fatty-acyl-phospholipid synthase-like methyltransferase